MTVCFAIAYANILTLTFIVEVPPTAHIPDYSALDTPAGDGQCFVPAQPPCISAQIPSSDTHAPIPIIHKVSAPRRQQSTLPAPTAANHESIDEELPVLSHVNPRRGSTSGGDEIYLVVRNLPPTAVLYARFGSNIAATVSRLLTPDLIEPNERA